MIPRQTIQYQSIQVYGSTTNGKEADVEQFYDELQGLQELTPKKKKKCPFHHRALKCRSKKSIDTWSKKQAWPWRTKLSRAFAKGQKNFAKRTHWS